MSMWSLAAVRQHLEPRGIRVSRAPASGGKTQYRASKLEGDKIVAVTAEDPETLYILAIRNIK